MPRCQSRIALLRGLRPSLQQKVHCSTCSRKCIFCDIWKLASLVYTHVPLSCRFSTTPEKLQRLSAEPAYDYTEAEKAIEAALDQERVRLASIMSICTVEGADLSEGLRMAHDRCLAKVENILIAEERFEEALIRAPSPDPYPSYQSHGSYYYESRRPSMVPMAA